MFTVGTFARAAGVSAKLLRAYDEAGLFRPAWVDPDSRYRYYSPAQLPALRRILALRDLGIGLDEIRELVAGGRDLREALERRRRELEDARAEVDRRLAALEIRVELADAADDQPDVVVRSVAPQLVATFDLRLRDDGDVGRAFYELEAYVRDAGARAHLPPGAIPEEHVIFVPLRRQIPPTERIGVRRLVGCRVVTALHRGDYDGLPAARRGLGTWVRAGDLRVTGPLRVLYLQFGAEAELDLPRGWVVERARDFLTELQLPIGPAPTGHRSRGARVGAR